MGILKKSYYTLQPHPSIKKGSTEEKKEQDGWVFSCCCLTLWILFAPFEKLLVFRFFIQLYICLNFFHILSIGPPFTGIL